MAPTLVTLTRQLLRTSPLRHPRFRLFYFGSIGAALGYTMQATLAAWLMATLTPSALMVALVQTASTLPTLLFGLFAGTLADIVDRRRIVFGTQVLLLAATALLGLATVTGIIGPIMLLLLTFLVGMGFTFYNPAQQASVNDFVGRAELSRAVALGAVAFNVARAIGPALAGAFAAWIGSGSALLASTLGFGLMLFATRAMKSRDRTLPGVPERMLSGILSGLRFVRHSPPMLAFLSRNLVFGFCASAFWALLPVIARDQFSMGAGGFGLLSAGFGSGAVVGALAIPRLLSGRSLQQIVSSSVVLWIAAAALIAVAQMPLFAVLGAFCGGMAWVGVFASVSAGTQSTVPAWVRARALAMNLVAIQASLALGSIAWGLLASGWGTRIAMGVSAAALAILAAATQRVRIRMGTEGDVSPGAQLPDLGLATEPDPEDGPVLIQLEYHVDRERQAEFLRAVHAVEPTRRRNGAVSWRVFRDLAEDGRFVERFIIDSWAEFVRLRMRMTVNDRQIQERVEHFQRPGVPIRVSRLIGVDPDDLDARADAGRS